MYKIFSLFTQSQWKKNDDGFCFLFWVPFCQNDIQIPHFCTLYLVQYLSCSERCSVFGLQREELEALHRWAGLFSIRMRRNMNLIGPFVISMDKCVRHLVYLITMSIRLVGGAQLHLNCIYWKIRKHQSPLDLTIWNEEMIC